MRIKHIYINKEGEPMANPEMEYPTLYFISGGHEVARTDLDEALAKYHSGLLPFEDSFKVKEIIFWDGKYALKRESTIPVDLEVEVVTQAIRINSYDHHGIKWFDCHPEWKGQDGCFEYRKVLRIKP